MRRSQLSDILVVLISAILPAFLQGQPSFAFHSELAALKNAGFHRIMLEPRIVARCSEGLEDIRIYDDQEKQVPYILQTGRGMLRIPFSGMEQKDSTDNSSYISIALDNNYLINFIEIHASGTRFYKRPVTVSSSGSRIKGLLSSASPSRLRCHIKGQELLLVIENGDNPPLEVSSVTLWQTERSLLSYLEEGKRYRLRFGNPALAAPKYDLSFFKDSIRGTARMLSSGPVIIDRPETPSAAKPAKNVYAWLLWPVIISVLLLLLLLTLRMTKEVNSKGDLPPE